MPAGGRDSNAFPRFVLRHPFLAALCGGPVLALWVLLVSGVSLPVAIVTGVAFALFLALGWFPQVGPMRRWIEKRYGGV